MTRINVIPPELLSNAHLMAEYRELPRIFTSVRKSLDKYGLQYTIKDINDSYCLGKGHVKFFYNKLPWIFNRYLLLINELLSRGYKLDPELFNKIINDNEYFLLSCSDLLKVEFLPDHNAMYLNMARIAKRSNMQNVLNELNDN